MVGPDDLGQSEEWLKEKAEIMNASAQKSEECDIELPAESLAKH